MIEIVKEPKLWYLAENLIPINTFPARKNVWYSDLLNSYKDDFLNQLSKITKETMEKPRPESRAIETQHNALLIKLSGLSIEKILRCRKS